MTFDFVYNQGFSRRHIQVAREFYECAEISLQRKNWSAFVENLFASAELSAKAVLLSIPNARFRKRATHREIQMRYNRFTGLGNIRPQFRTTLNKLSGWRDLARYPKVGEHLRIEEKEALELLRTVYDMIEDIERQLTETNRVSA